MKKKNKNLYKNIEWINFSEKVKKRDNYICQHCGRNEKKVILQVHHRIYKENKYIWEYALSDCISLCKGCHAREHGIIEPTYGWTLVNIIDLGELNGRCERKNCNTPIRYEHIAYHPKWGYKSVGSKCIEFLTEKDKLKSKEYLDLYKKISRVLNSTTWKQDRTKKNNKPFIYMEYQKSIIRIYGEEKKSTFAYQIAFYLGKNKNFEWNKIYSMGLESINNIENIKELALINLMGIIAKIKDKLEEYNVLRDIYINIKKSVK